MEKLKLSRHAGGNAKWSNHCGKVWQFLKKLNTEITISHSTSRYIPKRTENKDSNRSLYVHECGISHNSQKAETNPSVQKQMKRINKIRYVHKIEYYSAIKRNLDIHCTTQMNPENIVLSEKSHTQEDKYL